MKNQLNIPPTIRVGYQKRSDTYTGKLLQTLTGVHAHTSWVNTVAWSPDSKRLASGSYDQTIKIWDMVRKHYKI